MKSPNSVDWDIDSSWNNLTSNDVSQMRYFESFGKKWHDDDCENEMNEKCCGPTNKSRQQADNADNKSRALPTRRQQVLITSKMANRP